MHLPQEQWIAVYQKCGALWIHDGNPKRPHVLLTSDGKHSNGFFNSELVMENPLVLDWAARDLTKLLAAHATNATIGGVDRVVGPAMGAITLAHDLARCIGEVNCRPCLRGYGEKAEERGRDDRETKKKMVLKRTALKKGERILLCEDVLTSGASVNMVAEAVIAAGGEVLPYVAVLVNRSGLTEVSGKKIVALIDRHMPKWDPDECPLCKEGSEALRPKETWARLTAAY
ncbi:MAG: hypothetical protein HYS43_01785 [Candidatus Liptonbacteria bacterium]|nr:hypothetical protein [Candidatus Liptonbacteria bacterium]